MTIYGVVHEGQGTSYHADLRTAVAVADGMARDEPDGDIWIERYTVSKLSKGTLLSALCGRGWADGIRRERTIRQAGALEAK